MSFLFLHSRTIVHIRHSLRLAAIPLVAWLKHFAGNPSWVFWLCLCPFWMSVASQLPPWHREDIYEDMPF